MNQDTQSSISDDQELAKVLAGINPDEPQEFDIQMNSPAPTQKAIGQLDTTEESKEATMSKNESKNTFQPTPLAGGAALGDIKQQAILELHPIMSKLDATAENKFDAYLLILRSTDDKSLIQPAHEAAIAIEDEGRRAQALLDIIKEIDFFESREDK